MATVFEPNLGINVHITKAHKLRLATANRAVSSRRPGLGSIIKCGISTSAGLRVLMLEQITVTAERSVHEFPSWVALDYAACQRSRIERPCSTYWFCGRISYNGRGTDIYIDREVPFYK